MERSPEWLYTGKAMLIVPGEGVLNGVIDRRWNIWDIRPHRFKRIHTVVGRDSRNGINGGHARQQSVQRCSQSIDIGTLIRPAAGAVLLDWRIARRAVTKNGGGAILNKLLGGAKIDQHGFATIQRYDNIVGLNVSMHDGRLLAMQIDEGIHDGIHDGQGYDQRKTLSWLLLAQVFKVPAFDIGHEQVQAPESFIFKDVKDTGQRRVIEPFENLTLEYQTIAVWPARLDELFQRKHLLLDASIAYQVYSAKPPLAEKFFNTVTVSISILHVRPDRKRRLLFYHGTPSHPSSVNYANK